MRLSRRLVTGIIVGIGVLILSPILFCVGTIIYEELRPSAPAQLLDFAELPPDTPLPQRDTVFADRIDYHYVEDRLRERFPVGTSEQELNAFMTKHDNPCVRDKQKIYCRFMHSSFPCADKILVIFSLDTANTLKQIEISGRTDCL